MSGKLVQNRGFILSSSEELEKRLKTLELELRKVSPIVLEDRLADLESKFQKLDKIILEERIENVEMQIQKVKPIVKVAHNLSRNFRAVTICVLFIFTLILLSLDRIEVTKNGEVKIALGDIKIEAIYSGAIAISLILDRDIFRAKILPGLINSLNPGSRKK